MNLSINKLHREYNAAAMVAAVCSPQLQNVWALYRNNKTFRYSIYALEVLAIAGLGQNTKRVSISVLGITVLFLGHKIAAHYPYLQKIYAKDRRISLVEQAAMISQLMQIFFAAFLICGITLNGWNLSYALEQVKRLVQGVRNKDLFTCIHALNSLARLGSMAGSMAFFLIDQGDKFFHSTLGESSRSFVANFLNAHQKNKQIEFLKPYIDKLKSLFTTQVPGSIALEIYSFGHSFPRVHLFDCMKIMLLMRMLDTGTPKVIPLKNPTLWQRVQTTVNQSLFYGFAFSMLGVRIYYYPIPTLAAFLCGLFCPTQMRSRKDLEYRWERVPDFLGLSLRKKFEYIFQRTNLTLGGLRFGYPAAFMKGLFLAEEFRYYIGPHLKSWCPFPIEPLIPLNNRWLSFLSKEEFEKITADGSDPSDYQEFKQKILTGYNPRKLLGLKKEHSMDDIEKAYKKYTRQVHPNLPANLQKQEEATVLFKCLQEANKVLRELLKPSEKVVLETSREKSPPTSHVLMDLEADDQTSQVD